MSENDLLIQRIIAIMGMCVWFVFPIGMAISLIRQNNEQKSPHADLKTQLNDQSHTHSSYNSNEEFDDYEAPMKIDDFGHTHVNISPGPDHQHVNL